MPASVMFHPILAKWSQWLQDIVARAQSKQMASWYASAGTIMASVKFHPISAKWSQWLQDVITRALSSEMVS